MNITGEKNTKIHLYDISTRIQEKVWQIGFGISVTSGGWVAGENKYRLWPPAKSGRSKKVDHAIGDATNVGDNCHNTFW